MNHVIRHRSERLPSSQLLIPTLPAAAGFFRPGYHCLFGGCPIDPIAAEGHFGIIGGPGTGKGRLMHTLMASVIPFFNRGFAGRAMIFDAKQDTVPLLRMLGVAPTRIILSDPFVLGSSRWDVARDVQSHADAQQFSKLLVPQNGGENNKFFYDAPRLLLRGVMEVLMARSGGRWTLGDLIRIMLDTSHMSHVLKLDPRYRTLVKICRKVTSRAFQSIYFTMACELEPLLIASNLWEHATGVFSIRDWLESDSILVLGHSSESPEAQQILNRLIVNRAAQFLLRGPDQREDITWMFFDELSETHQLDSLPGLMLRGRSKGVRIVWAFQSIPGLRINYKPDIALAIAGLARNQSYLNLSCPETADWVSRRIGEFESMTRKMSMGYSSSYSSGPGGPTGGSGFNQGYSWDFERVTAVMPSQLMHELPIMEGGCVHGYHAIPSARCVFYAAHPYASFEYPQTRAYALRPHEQQMGPPLNADDWQRLGITPPREDRQLSGSNSEDEVPRVTKQHRLARPIDLIGSFPELIAEDAQLFDDWQRDYRDDYHEEP